MIELPTNISLLIEQSVNILEKSCNTLRLTAEEQYFLCNNFVKKEIRKNTILTQKENINNFIYFIEKGIIRHWISNDNNEIEKELTFWFSFSGEFIDQCLLTSINNQSSNNIQAVSDCIIWEIDKLQIKYICNNSLNLNKIMRIFEREILERLFRKGIRDLMFTGEKRYTNLINENKYFIQNIPLKYIASYIGITPQTLSRIRKQIFKNKIVQY